MNKTNLFLIAVVIVLAFLLFRECRKPPVQPKVISNTEIVKMVDSTETKRVTDSIIRENTDRHAEVVVLYDRIEQLTNKSKALKYERDEAISALENEQQRNDLTRIATQTDRNDKDKDSAYDQTVSRLKSIISGKEKIIQEQTKYRSKVLKALDSCMKAKGQVEDYAGKVKPTNQVYAGVHAMGNTQSFITGFGVQAGMIFKSGTILQIQATQIGSTINYGLGLSKVITLKRK